ncbi:MAG: hypothetical protein Q4C13_01880 [Clostridia bacterium]|nr:hypothetical protein [Clostridia bacterium]
MKFFKAIGRFIPHLTIVFSLMTLVFFCIDRVNTAMAFMSSELSKWVFAILAALACASACMLVAAQWKDDARKARRDARRRARERAEHPEA